MKLTEREINNLFTQNEKFLKSIFKKKIYDYDTNIFNRRPIEIQDAIQECMIEFFYLLRDKYNPDKAIWIIFFRGHLNTIVMKVMKRILQSSHYCGTTVLTKKSNKGREDQGRSLQKRIDDSTIRDDCYQFLIAPHSNKRPKERVIDRIEDPTNCEESISSELFCKDLLDELDKRLNPVRKEILKYLLIGYTAWEMTDFISLQRSSIEYHVEMIQKELTKILRKE